MGCDFYISKYLEIEHENGISYYFLKFERGWYCDVGINWYDSDGEDDEHYMAKESSKLYYDMINLCLTPRKPVILYENSKFVSKEIEEKYLHLIEDRINNKYIQENFSLKDTGNFTKIEEIIRITKKEYRYER